MELGTVPKPLQGTKKQLEIRKMWNLGKKSGAIVLSTAITPNYLRKAADFIRSINENSNCDANVVILVCGIESLNTELLEIFNSISFARYFNPDFAIGMG
ncbi:MAG: hypothetical protein NTW91_10725 [Verrucomicrobia bacterium]|nr:hypothetical protein [Verrucomicrobiota bacterium]